MSAIQDVVALLSFQDQVTLIRESEEWNKTSVVPDESMLRAVTEKIFGDSSALQMLVVSREVYRNVALASIATNVNTGLEKI